MALTEQEERLLDLYAEGELRDTADLRFVRERLARCRAWREALAAHDELTYRLLAGDSVADDSFGATEAARERTRRVEGVLEHLAGEPPPAWLADCRSLAVCDAERNAAARPPATVDPRPAALPAGSVASSIGLRWAAMVVASASILVLVLRGRDDATRPDGGEPERFVPVAVRTASDAHREGSRVPRMAAAELLWSVDRPGDSRAAPSDFEETILRGFSPRPLDEGVSFDTIGTIGARGNLGIYGVASREPEVELLVVLDGAQPALDHRVVLVPEDWDGDPAALRPIRRVLSIPDGLAAELSRVERSGPRFYRIYVRREVRVRAVLDVLPSGTAPPSFLPPGAGGRIAAPAFVPVLDPAPGGYPHGRRRIY